jgi:hypothetical protein
MININGRFIWQKSNYLRSNEIIGGSAAVILRTPDSIVVAADSKTIYLNKEDTEKKMCKIYYFSKHKTGFVAAGSIINTKLDYNLRSIAEESCKLNANISEKGDRFIQKTLPKFIENLESMVIFKNNHNFDIREQSAQVCFFGFENDIPKVSHIKIVPNINFFETGKYEIFRKNTEDKNYGKTRVYFLGASDEMYNALKPDIMKLPYKNAAEKLLKIAIMKNPKTVGYPINVLVVNRNNVYWYKNSICSDL